HRLRFLLNLPPAVARAGVLDRQLEARHARIVALYNRVRMAEGLPAPRLVVTDALGRRIVPIDKPLFTIGRRSETDLRLPGADISRVHAEIVTGNGSSTIRDHGSRFGTFVNGERIAERMLVHGDRIRLGQSDEVGILFAIGDEAPSVEKSAISAATELRQMA